MSRRFVVQAMFGLMVVALGATANAQPGGGGRGFDPAMMLGFSEQMQKELDLSEDQVAEIRELSGKLRERGLSQEDRADILDEIKNDVLFRPQRERLAQIGNQLRARGEASGLTGEFLREELDITDEQLEELKEVAEEANEELQKKIAELRADAQKKILGVLSSKQQKKYEELMGKPFQLNFGGGGRGGTGRGGTGRGGTGRGGRGGGRGGDGGGNRPTRPDA